MDDPLLTIDAEAGELVAAARRGRCGWNGAGLIGAILFDDALTPLPNSKILVCQLSIRVRENVVNRRAEMRFVDSHCSDASAEDVSCEHQNGYIEITGGIDIDPDEYIFPKESTRLLILIREGDAADQLRNLAADRVDDPGFGDLLEGASTLGIGTLRAAVPPSRRAVGDELARYLSLPNLPAAKMQRMLVAEFATVSARDAAMERFQRNPIVEAVTIDPVVTAVAPRGLPAVGNKSESRQNMKWAWGSVLAQPHLGMLGIPVAKSIAPGWGQVGIVDVGLATNHVELRSFTGGGSIGGNFVQGGNFLPDASMNISDPTRNPWDGNVDTLRPSFAKLGEEVCDQNQDGYLDAFAYAGHGTHVAGLIGANDADASGVSGVCAGCGIAMFRIAYFYCSVSTSSVKIGFDTDGAQNAANSGSQVINFSFGGTGYNCDSSSSNLPICLMINTAEARDIAVVAASGNYRKPSLNAPANGRRVIAVGGVEDTAGTFWDDYPSCPYPSYSDPNTDCGSNYQGSATSYAWQELVALSKNAVSTTYPNHDWSPALQCGDSWGSSSTSDGLGTCTGTSMSTPEVSGIVGLLRSINPLLKVGQAGPSAGQMQGGIRQVLAETAGRAQAGQSWDSMLGFGIPNAGLAARRILGTARGDLVPNRAIPLFSLYSSGAQDYAAVATPQMAMHLALDSANAYAPDGNSSLAIPGYLNYPDTSAGAPRARVYVLSTDKKPDPGFPSLVPLYLMEKIGTGSLRDHVLLSSTAVVQSAANSSPRYRYLGIQGYIYQDCQGQPGCTIPPGTEILHLMCKSSWDCAVFPESDRVAGANFNAQGYVNLFPGMSSSRLGYAYARGDADGDGLPDAAEHVLSTRPDLQDTDGDGVNDGAEYPLSGLPDSDPCDGPLDRCTRPSTYIFDNGFEGGL